MKIFSITGPFQIFTNKWLRFIKMSTNGQSDFRTNKETPTRYGKYKNYM
jgi:hypothetical protein